MDYQVAAEDSNFMEQDWLTASGDKGIPKAFVVDAEGRVAWFGHPHELDKVLSKIVSGTWDIKEALTRRIEENRLKELDNEVQYELARYSSNPLKPEDPGKPDSVLFVISELVKKDR